MIYLYIIYVVCISRLYMSYNLYIIYIVVVIVIFVIMFIMIRSGSHNQSVTPNFLGILYIGSFHVRIAGI
jgi:hypothetical protein